MVDGTVAVVVVVVYVVEAVAVVRCLEQLPKDSLGPNAAETEKITLMAG